RSSTDIDYAFSPIDDFDSFVHRFSFTFTFGVAQDVLPLNRVDTEQITEYQRQLEDELRAAREARERMDAAVRDAEERTRQLEEEMATRLERIQKIALTSAGKIEVIPDRTDSTRILVSLRINFAFDSEEIRPTEFETMRKVAEILNTYPEAKLLIAGHTDSIGTYDYNIHLSQRRMESVMNYLITKGGVPQSRFQYPVAYGEMRPVADNGTAAGQARNRRVDFEIITTDNDPGIPEGSSIMSVRAVNDSAFAIICNGVIDKFEIEEMGFTNKLIVDFPGTFNLIRQKNFEIHRGKVVRARVGYHPQGIFTRVVFDLTGRSQYSAQSIDNSILVIIR
ncbi:MAG: OmpA family protein, partial [bacterium]